MAKTIRCTIVTPTGSVFDDPVTYASIPAWDGQLGIMVGQSPVLTRLDAGALKLEMPDGSERWYLIDGGFARVRDDGLMLLTDQAVAAGDLSREQAEAELAEANAAVSAGGQDQASVSMAQRRALAKLALIRKRPAS